MTDGDQTLVIRGRLGDRSAFEELVRRTARGLFARIYLQVADVHRTEDLLQETFLRAWKRLPTLSDPNAFRGWLNAIATSVVIDSAKERSRIKRGWFQTRSDEPAMLKVADESATPMQVMEQNEQRDQMLKLLKNLPPEYREVLTLRYIAGADYEAISKELALTNGSLRGLLNRGMKLLREQMQRVTTDERR